jgi:tripartite-type tricarboxylate transporter receptor subunit TctC
MAAHGARKPLTGGHMAIVIGRREPWSGYMKKFFSFALALLTTSIVSALAQTYPTRTITIVIAFPPGGPNEGVVRFLAEKLTPSLGQAVIIENRPGGAGGTVGTRSVANAAPDGHALLLSPPGPLVVAPLIYKNVGYDPTKPLLRSRPSSASRKCWSSIQLFP